MEIQKYLILKWVFLLFVAKSIVGDIYDDDRNKEPYDPYNTNQDQYGRDNYNRNQYDNRNNQTGNYDPYNRNRDYGRNDQRYNSSDPYNRDPYNINPNDRNPTDPNNRNDPYNRNQNNPYNRNQNDPYNRNQNDPYNKNQNDPYNRNPNDPYNRNQNDPFNKNQNDPYNKNQNDPYNRNSNDPYNRNDNTRNPNDPYNTNNRNQNDPYNRNQQDPYNRNQHDPYNRNQNDYNRDRNQGDLNRNYDNREDRFRNNDSNYGSGRFGADDGSCCEEYCYSIDSAAFLKMASKTSYQFVYGRTSNQHVVPQCKPVQYWSVFREGTSIPDRMSIERYRNLQRIHDLIVKNYEERKSYPDRGKLCGEDYSLLKSWRWNDTVSEQRAGSLSGQGAEDLKYIARRIQSRFRDLFVPYSETQYYFEYTEGDKSYESYQAFVRGLFGNDAQRVHATVRNPASFNNYGDSNSNQIYSPFSQGSYAPSFSENRESSQYGTTPDSRCKSFVQRNDEDRNTASEYQTFKQKQEYRDMVRNVFKRLGFGHVLNDTIIEDMYDMCRYEKSWYITSNSPWCAAFTHSQQKLLEYGDDLFYYYRSGYGHEHLNKNLGCGLLKDLYERFERIVDGSFDQAKGIVHFRNIDEMLKLMVALGIGQDQSILTADNYYQMDRRQWKTSNLSPFSGNLAAVLYQCDNQNDKYKVMFFLNENPVEFPECSVGLCSWEIVREKYQMLAQNCRLDFCERGAAHINTSASLVLICSTLFTLLYKHMF